MRILLIALVFTCLGCASRNPVPPTTTSTMQPVARRDASWMSGPGSIIDRMRGRTPIKWVQMMENTASADDRRMGIIQLMQTEFGKHEPYTKRYRQIAQADPDFTVRAAALRALNASRDAAAIPIFIAALKDEYELVRWQAAKALSNIPDPSAVNPLLAVLNNINETKTVRLAATDALRHYRDPVVTKRLIAGLNDKDFGVAWQARQSLKTITGRDFRYNERAWNDYVASNATKPVG
jgi:hypothetical protein